jgi:DNA-binding FrmR family transcriptional regulator
MRFPDEVAASLRNRLRRAEGQVRAVTKMLDEGRDCRDVVTQLSAAQRALDAAGFHLMSAAMSHCMEHPEETAAAGMDMAELERMFMKLA